MSNMAESNNSPRVALTEAALGALANDPAFQARFGGEVADPPKAEDREEVDPDSPGEEEETPKPDTAVPPDSVEARLAKLEKVAEDRQSFITQLQNENKELRERAAAPPETEIAADPYEELEQYGVPGDVAKRLIRAEAISVVKEYFAPMIQVADAEKALGADPAYAAHASNLEAFVRENKEIADTVLALANTGKIKEAKSYAWREYKLAKASEIEAPKKAAADKQRAERAEAKNDAGISPTQKAETRTPKDDASNVNATNLEKAQRTGSSKDVGRYIADALFRKPQ